MSDRQPPAAPSLQASLPSSLPSSLPASRGPSKAPYAAPVLERFGSVRDQTLARSNIGRMDGAPMNLRTG